MKKLITLTAIVLGLTLTPVAHAWDSYLDGSSIPGAPWSPYIDPPSEGTTVIVPIGGGNNALELNSSAHSDGENPGASVNHANEYYTFSTGRTENLGAARFRLVSFTPTGKENLLSVAVGGTPSVVDGENSPSITLVNGDYWIWSYTSNEPIFKLGPAVAGEWHEAYVLALSNGTAGVWWDGGLVFNGPVPLVVDQGDYVEFGSGTYWQTTAGTVVDFDWVGWGNSTDFPVPEPATFGLAVLVGIGLLVFRRSRIGQ